MRQIERDTERERAREREKFRVRERVREIECERERKITMDRVDFRSLSACQFHLAHNYSRADGRQHGRRIIKTNSVNRKHRSIRTHTHTHTHTQTNTHTEHTRQHKVQKKSRSSTSTFMTSPPSKAQRARPRTLPRKG